MLFTSDYNVLVSNMADISTVVEDSNAKEGTRNILFKFKIGEDGSKECTMIGVTPTLTYKKHLLPEDFTLELNEDEMDSDGVCYMQLRSKEILSFLNSYKSLRKSAVDSVQFTMEHGKVKCTVVERFVFSEQEEEQLRFEDKYDEMVSKRVSSHWMFNPIQVAPNIMGYVELTPPEDGMVTIDSGILKNYTSSLIPIMESGNSVYSQIQFDKECVVVINQAFNTLMSSQKLLATVLDNVKFNYKSISFIEKTMCANDTFDIAKMEKFIVFKTDTSEAFVSYSTKLASYKTNFDFIAKKDKYFQVDRIYLKDVLKRLSLINDSIHVVVDANEGKMTLSNSKFSQDIDIQGQKGMEGVGVLKFTVAPDVMNKAIIGDDTKFTEGASERPELAYTRILYCPLTDGKSAGIVFTDASGIWFSVMRTKVY